MAALSPTTGELEKSEQSPTATAQADEEALSDEVKTSRAGGSDHSDDGGPPSNSGSPREDNLKSNKGKAPLSGLDEDEDADADEGTTYTPPLPVESIPPLPEEPIPPLPAEAPPTATPEDDGWEAVWETSANSFYFYNRFTGATQWTNPRVPEPAQSGPPGVEPVIAASSSEPPAPATAPPAGGYNPAIHGDYDPTAWYAQPAASEEPAAKPADPASVYGATAAFNRFTGRFQDASLTPENFNDENKSKRQLNVYFDADAAANSHNGKSLKAERSGKKLSKTELKQFKEKRKAKKEEKRRAWLRD